MTSTRAPRTADPLASLPVRPDGAMTWRVDSDGRWQYAGAGKVPTLKGIKGVWNGYSDTAGWSYSFGWPDDYRAVERTALWKADKQVAELWVYEFPSKPGLRVLFVYLSMKTWTDANGEHDGHHDFVWHGSLVENSDEE